MTTVIEQVLTTWPDHLHATQPFDIESAISQLVRQAIIRSLFHTVGIEASLESIGPLFHLHEITSKGLLWAIHFLADELAFRRRIRHEVKAVLGWRKPTFADLEGLPCTRMLFQEALHRHADPFIPSSRLMQYVDHPLPNSRLKQAALIVGAIFVVDRAANRRQSRTGVVDWPVRAGHDPAALY